MMVENIGNVKLDYNKYPGEDFYCDGEVEDEILEIVRKYSPVEYRREIEERKSWPILYHLSPLRENIVEWLPIKNTDKVLEVGSGCGAITGALARKAESVTCVDLSKKRSMINAYRHAECDNVTIHVGNFKDIEPDLPNDFDYICLIGVFEYGQAYIGGETPFQDFLNILMPHLSENGRVVIAIENKYGLKYFAGCKEDHLGTWFSGIENYSCGGGVRTFSRRGLEKIFQSCQIKEFRFYYPYPDYKFMTTLYSDTYLPGKGELSNNHRNFDRDRMLLFDEKSAFDGLIEDGMFPFFANSFCAVIGAPIDVKYVKYSNDRAPEYTIKTEISRNEAGEIKVRKYPIGDVAKDHVRGMADAYSELVKRYADSELEINQCELVETDEEVYAEFEFVNGTPLSELMDDCIEREDMERFYEYFKKYVELTGYNDSYPVADFDLIFANILVDKDKWTLIDYEWTFGKPISAKALAFRAVYCYLLEDEKRNRIELDRILEELQITEAEAQELREEEADFQQFVTGKQASMAQIRDLIGYRMMTPQKWIDRYEDSEAVNRVQVYEDYGDGFKEEESYFVPEAYQGENSIALALSVDRNVKVLRVDPAFSACIVEMEEMTWNGETVPLDKNKLFAVNGKIAKPATLIFPTEDPNININLQDFKFMDENTLTLRMSIVRVPVSMAGKLANSVKKIF